MHTKQETTKKRMRINEMTNVSWMKATNRGVNTNTCNKTTSLIPALLWFTAVNFHSIQTPLFTLFTPI